MSDTARAIYADAPLGSIIAFTDGASRPPDRFKRKLSSWQDQNGRGRLVGRTPSWRPGGTDSFTLHLGNYGFQGVTVIVLNRSYTTDSALAFSIEQPPAPGTVQVVTDFAGGVELRHQAHDRAAAEAWLARNRYSDARIVVVGEAETPCHVSA